jgi:hypothetical protein
MATAEQSLMEMDRIASQFFSRSLFPITRVREGEDDFFNDLTVKSSDEVPDPKKASGSDASDRSYSSYSFSSSTVVDEEGHRVSTTRRRYEDSTGRLKALHEREIDGKKLKNVWQRKNASEKGEHHSMCIGANADEFESQWKHTPFGQAEEEQQKKQVSEGSAKDEDEAKRLGEEQPAKSAFGIDYEAAKAAPANDSKHGKGVTKEAQARSREDAIAQGSKTQEEETTPPNYT